MLQYPFIISTLCFNVFFKPFHTKECFAICEMLPNGENFITITVFSVNKGRHGTDPWTTP